MGNELVAQRDRFDTGTTWRLLQVQSKRAQSLGHQLLENKEGRISQPARLRVCLAEHPSDNVELFVTSFLHSEAAGKPDCIAALTPYFTTVVSRVNRGRVAKDRVLSFLSEQALTSEAIATIVTPMLTRVSGSAAIGDRAACVRILSHLQHLYPALLIPLTEMPSIRPASRIGAA